MTDENICITFTHLHLINVVEGAVTSEPFDITLFYKIIRKTTKVKKPRKGWGEEPDYSDVTPADDLERVRICRNLIVHNPLSVRDSVFEVKWNELHEVRDLLQDISQLYLDLVVKKKP